MMKKFSIFLAVFFAFSAVTFAQQNKPFELLERPTPEAPSTYSGPNENGTIKIKVEFLSIGEIGEVTLVSGLNPVLNARALEAVKNIKFSPEIRDGQPIGDNKIIEYVYNYGWVNYVPPVAFSRPQTDQTEKAEAILKLALEKVGGSKYLQVQNVFGKGAYSYYRDASRIDYSTFIDLIVFPDRERTEFKSGGYKTTQVNTGDTGWIYGEDTRSITDQTKNQIDDFKRSMKVSLDQLLRGKWRADGGKLSYVGRRPVSLGRRNDVIKITYPDGFWVEFEFGTHDGLPSKAVFERKNTDGVTVKEEDRYAQFVDVGGISAPYIIDRFRDGKQISRVNYSLIEYNKAVPAGAFEKPADIKVAKKDLKW